MSAGAFLSRYSALLVGRFGAGARALPTVFLPLAQTTAAPEGEPPWLLFLVLLAATVALLVVDLWTGVRARRRAHVPCAIATLPCLWATVWFADAVGRFWTFPALPLDTHLAFAKSGLLLSFVVGISGLLSLRGKLAARWHRYIAWTFVVFVGLSAATAVWMFLAGQPR